MALKHRAFRIACVLFVFGWAATAQAQNWGFLYSVATGVGDGGQLQIGTGLPLPIQFPGGPNVGPTFPSLLIPVVPGAVVQQPTTPGVLPLSPKPMRIPPAILSAPAPAGTMAVVGQFQANPALWQVGTTFSFAWPEKMRTLFAGGRPGLPVSVKAGPGGGTVTYTAGAAQFGGPARFTMAWGPGTAGGLIPGAPATVWVNYLGQTPAIASRAGLAAAYPGPSAQAGATTGIMTATPGTPLAPTGFRAIGTGVGGGVNAFGSIMGSVGIAPGGLNNMATSSAGFPWTTGMITVAAAAVPPEIFVLTGSDARNAFGVGTISLVSGGTSARALSGPNANRGWVRLTTLPEPAAVLGVLSAFAMLGLCHAGLARRRSSR
jgi:hypothetical protein